MNYINKGIAVIISIALLLGCFSMNSTKSNAVSKYHYALRAYENFLGDEKIYVKGMEVIPDDYTRFLTLDINGDKVPELIVRGLANQCGSFCDTAIYTYYKGQRVLAGTLGRGVGYSKKKNRIYSVECNRGAITKWYYKIGKGKLVLMASATESFGKDYVRRYSVKNKTTTKRKYNKFVHKFMKGKALQQYNGITWTPVHVWERLNGGVWH